MAALIRSTMLALSLAQASRAAADTGATTSHGQASASSASGPVHSAALTRQRSAFKLRFIPLTRFSTEGFTLFGGAASVEIAPIWIGELGADLMFRSVGAYFAVGAAPPINDTRASDATGSFHRANLMLGFRHIAVYHEADGYEGTEKNEVAFMTAGLDFTWWTSSTFGLGTRVSASAGLPFAQSQSWAEDHPYLGDIEPMSVFVDGSVSFGLAFAGAPRAR